MTGICGWVNYKTEDLQNNEILAKMSSSLMPLVTAQQQIITNSVAAYIDHPNAPKQLAQEDGIIATISGFPKWSSKKYSEICATLGAAKTLLNVYKEHGNKCINFLTDSYSIAIIDSKNDYAFLAIDKLGIETLRYSLTANGVFLFATTNSAITKHPGANSSINKQAIYDYTFFHSIPSPDTIYKDIYKLKPAECIEYKNGNLTKSTYWKPSFCTNNNNRDIAEYSKQLHTVLNNSVAEMATGPTCGSFLSGGLDSSTVTGMLSHNSETTSNAFSIGFSAEGYDEMEYARIAANHFKVKLHEHYVTPDEVKDAAMIIANIYDEPFGNSSAIPTYLCAKLAKNAGITTMLAGDGGDELFAGNTRYVKQNVFEAYRKLPSFLRESLIEKILGNSEWPNQVPILNKINSYIRQAAIPMPARMYSYNYLVRTNNEDIFTKNYLNQIDTSYLYQTLAETYAQTDGDSLVNRMLHFDWKYTLADNDIRKVDVMCQQAGIQVKFPMLNEDLLNLSLDVKENIKIKDKKLRYFYKEAMKSFLPLEIINKSKHGFGLPFGEWLKESVTLKEFVYDNLHSLKKRDIFQPVFIESLIDTHKSGHAAYYGTMIWVLLMLELWMKSHNAQMN